MCHLFFDLLWQNSCRCRYRRGRMYKTCKAGQGKWKIQSRRSGNQLVERQRSAWQSNASPNKEEYCTPSYRLLPKNVRNRWCGDIYKVTVKSILLLVELRLWNAMPRNIIKIGSENLTLISMFCSIGNLLPVIALVLQQKCWMILACLCLWEMVVRRITPSSIKYWINMRKIFFVAKMKGIAMFVTRIF